MKLIAAVDSKWGIGKDGELLTSIPEDMKFFRETTRNHVLVMGYNTLLSFPNGQPLRGRLNITVSSKPDRRAAGCIVCGGTEQLMDLLREFASDDVFVIGGGRIYNQLLPYCSTAYITKMDFDGGADTFMPNIDELGSWEAVSESECKTHDGIDFRFVEYRNHEVKPIGFTAACPDMSAYFKNKSVLFKLADFGDKRGSESEKSYFAELKDLLRAYFKPLEKGFTSADVSRFEEEREKSKKSLEEYLRDKRFVASEEDFESLFKKYDSDKELKYSEVRVDKEELEGFEQSLSSDSAHPIITEIFNV